MKVGLSQTISPEVNDKMPLFSNISELLKETFENKFFGDDLLDLTFGIICIEPKFDQFFKFRKKYYAGKKNISHDGVTYIVENALEYNIKLTFNEFKEMKYERAQEFLLKAIYNSLDEIKTTPEIKNFDLEGFKDYFKENTTELKLMEHNFE